LADSAAGPGHFAEDVDWLFPFFPPSRGGTAFFIKTEEDAGVLKRTGGGRTRLRE